MGEDRAPTRDEVVGAIVAVLEGDEPASRCAAVRALERIGAGDEVGRGRLLALLRDPDPEVRMEAAAALGRIGAGEATAPLLDIVQGDADGEVRIQAVNALAGIRPPGAVEPLIRCLEADGYPELDQPVDDIEYCASWEVQSRALEALGALGDARAVGPIIELLRRPELEDLHESSFRILAGLDGDRAREHLLEQLRAGERLARRRAARALTTLPEFAGARGVVPAELLGAVTEALGDRDPVVRAGAVRALGATANPQVALQLTALLADPDAEVRREVAQVLANSGGREIAERVHALLDEADASALRLSVRVLGEIAEPTSAKPLAALLDCEDPELLYEVVRALGAVAVAGPEQRIAAILADEGAEPLVRIQAAAALARIVSAGPTGEPGPEEVLNGVAFDRDERVGYAAMAALAQANPERAAERLTTLLRETTPAPRAHAEETQEAADPSAEEEGARTEVAEWVEQSIAAGDPEASTLASIGADLAVTTPAPAAESDRPPADPRRDRVRIFAAKLLGGVAAPGSEAVDALVQAADADAPELREAALRALGRIGDERAVPAIRRGLRAEQAQIRTAALDAIAGIGGGAASDRDAAMLVRDPDPVVRQRAVEVLGSRRAAGLGETLSRALEDEDRGVCRAALSALSEDVYGTGHGQRILDLMFRFSGELAKEAAVALRRLHDLSSASRLLARLAAPEHERVHWLCIDCLGELYAEESVDVDGG